MAPICSEIVQGLQKIYPAKNVVCDIQIADDASCKVEQGDLYELTGNVMDNAWKYCRGKVVCKARVDGPEGDKVRSTLMFSVEDDGPGIPEERISEVLSRGGRLVERGDVPGQGIGLAVVTEIVGLYSGRVDIRHSKLGGALVEISLPR